MNPSDTVTIYGSPYKREYPIGKARLIKKLSESGYLESWEVQFTNEEIIRVVSIRKQDEKVNPTFLG